MKWIPLFKWVTESISLGEWWSYRQNLNYKSKVVEAQKTTGIWFDSWGIRDLQASHFTEDQCHNHETFFSENVSEQGTTVEENQLTHVSMNQFSILRLLLPDANTLLLKR